MASVAKKEGGVSAIVGRTVPEDAADPVPAFAKWNITSAMAAAFAEIEGATKSAKNPHFKTKYADITSVIEAIKPALIAHNLFFVQRSIASERGVTVNTVLHHASGESMDLGELFVPANKNDAQGYGSALTYARRYSLVTAFGVPVEDDDGNAAARGIKQESAMSPPQSQLREQLEQSVEQGKHDARKDPWSKFYSGKSALHKGLTTHSAELTRLGDEGSSDDLEAYLTSPEYVDFIAVAGEHAPHYLEGGPPAPEEFVGIFKLEQRARDMIAMRSGEAADAPLTPINAG